MYTQDDTMTPRDRISDEMLQRMLHGNVANGGLSQIPSDHTHTPMPIPHEHTTWGIVGYPLASMYAPLQEFRSLYDADTALKKGTLFSELYLPFMGDTVAMKGGVCRD